LDRLERVLDCRRLDLLDAFEALDRQSILKCDGEAVYVKHDLLSEAALAKLSVTAAQFLHDQIGHVLEADLTPKNYGSLLWDSAAHLKAAGKVESAVRLMARCADRALHLGFANDAVAIWERARDLAPLNTEQGFRIQRGLISCLRDAGMWQKMLCVAAGATGGSSNYEAVGSQHDDAELAILEARWYGSVQSGELLPRLLNCAHAIKAPTPHRAEAGVLALVLAHNLPSRTIANEAYAIVVGLAGYSDDLVRQQLTAELVYQTAFGDLHAGVEAGRELIGVTRGKKSVTGLIRALRGAAVPLLYGGDFSKARLLLLEARDLALECGLAGATLTATEMLAKSYFQEGNYAAAKDWIASSQNISVGPEGRDVLSKFHAAQAQIALLENRSNDDAIQAFSDYTSWADVPLFRFRSTAYAIVAASRVASGEEFHQLREFENAFNQSCRSGGQDFAAYALFMLQSHAGERAAAINQLRHYVQVQRRERSVLPNFLAQALC
jgi:hypothetical protein